MRTVLYLLIVLLLCCCSAKQRHQDALKDIDEIILHHSTPADSSTKTYTDIEKINMFKEIINGKREDIKTNFARGTIKYMKNGECILTATMTLEGCKYFFESDTFKTRVTYRVGQTWAGL